MKLNRTRVRYIKFALMITFLRLSDRTISWHGFRFLLINFYIKLAIFGPKIFFAAIMSSLSIGRFCIVPVSMASMKSLELGNPNSIWGLRADFSLLQTSLLYLSIFFATLFIRSAQKLFHSDWCSSSWCFSSIAFMTMPFWFPLLSLRFN